MQENINQCTMGTSECFLEGLCRTCMQELTDTASNTVDTKSRWKPIFENITESDMFSAADLLFKTMPQIKVHLSDNLPKKICSECLRRLLNSYRFQQMCLQTEQKFQKLLGNKLDIQLTKEDAPDIKEISENWRSQEEEKPLSASSEQEPVVVSTDNLSPPTVDPLQNFGKEIEINKIELDNENEFGAIKREPFDEYVNDNEVDDDDGDDNDDGDDVVYDPSVEHSDSNGSLPPRVYVKDGIVATTAPEREEVSLPVPTYPCPICNMTFTQSRYLKCHLRRVKKCKPGDTARNRHYKDSHRNTSVSNSEEQVSLGSRTYPCPTCKKVFAQYRYLKNHFKRIKKCKPIDAVVKKVQGPVTCEICGKTISSSSNLVKHKKWRHPELYPEKMKEHKCEICGKGFLKSFALKEHMRLHTGERPHLCPECGKSFRTVGTFHQHYPRHFEKTVECLHCPAKFYSKSDLLKHNSIHEGIKRHVCDVCGEAFYKPYSLRKHKRYHSGEKPYKCEYCDMRFTVRHGQQRHMRTHTGEKPYKCKYCTFAFAQSNDLMKHLRIHLGENVYRCKLCPAGFQKLSELRVHFATHKSDDAETRERNLNALKEAEAKLPFKIGPKKSEANNI